MAALLALTSSLLWGSADFFGGLASKRRAAAAVVGGSQLLSLAVVLVVALATDAWTSDLRWLGWGVFSGLAGCIALASFYTALATGTMGVVSPIASLGVVVPVAVGLATGDSPARMQIAGIAVAIFGVLAASGPELSGDTGRRAVVLAVVAGLGFGLVFVGLDHGSRASTTMTLVAMRTTSCTLLVVLALVTRSVGGLRPTDLPVLAAVGLGDLGANFTFGLASTRGLVSVVSVLAALYPVVTVLLARTVLGERLRPIQQAGVGVALVGVALISVG